MILTVTLNPVIVRQMFVEGIQIDAKNLTTRDELKIGDCGIYSAYVIKVLQGEPYVLGVSGGIGGRFIKNYLDKNRIKSDFLQVDHETKTYLILSDVVNDTRTMFVSHNQNMIKKDYVNIKHKMHHHINDTDLVVVSGHDEWCEMLLGDIRHSKPDVRIISEINSDTCRNCLKSGMYAAVIDSKVLENMGYAFPAGPISYETMMEFRHQYHLKYLIVKGRYEIVGFTKHKIAKVHYHSKDTIYPIVKSMVLGGLAVGIKRGYTFERILKLLGAIADNSSSSQFPFVIKRNEVERGMRHVKLHEIYNQRNGFVIKDEPNESLSNHS